MLDLESILTLLSLIVFLGAIAVGTLLYACCAVSSDCSRREEEYEATHKEADDGQPLG